MKNYKIIIYNKYNVEIYQTKISAENEIVAVDEAIKDLTMMQDDKIEVIEI